MYRLKTARSQQAAENEELLIGVYAGSPEVHTPAQDHEDATAVTVLQQYQPAVLQQYSPRAVAGDGNCCYRYVSLALYGEQRHHMYVRVMTAVELLKHRRYYDVHSKDYTGALDVNDAVYVGDYNNLLDMVLTEGGYAELMHLYAISAAIGKRG